MKRLSLLALAIAFLMTASGCCCGWLHGCNSCNSCGYPSTCGYGGCGNTCGYGGGYAPAYQQAPCPTCPTGGCGVQGPVYQQGAFYDGASSIHASTTPSPATVTPALAAADTLPTY